MKSRLRTALAALKGQPIIAGVDIRYAYICAPKAIWVGSHTVLHCNKFSFTPQPGSDV